MVQGLQLGSFAFINRKRNCLIIIDLTIVGNVQLNNNNYIYFKKVEWKSVDPHIIYDSSNNFKIFNPVSGEIQLHVGSSEIVICRWWWIDI